MSPTTPRQLVYDMTAPPYSRIDLSWQPLPYFFSKISRHHFPYLASLAAENILEEFDVEIEVVVNLRRGKCRCDALQQSRRVGRSVAAVGNTPERARHLLAFLREHEINEEFSRTRMRGFR